MTDERTPHQIMRARMVSAIKELIGDIYIYDYYDSLADDFIGVAEMYVEDLARLAGPVGVQP